MKKEDIFFLNNTLDYWVWTVLLTSFVFFILYVVRNLVEKPFLKAILTPFSSISYLIVNIISDNVVFFTFRGYTQLQFLVPDKHALFLSTLNITLAIASLWVAVCVGIAIPIFIYLWGLPFEIDGMKNRLGSYLLLSVLQLFRIVSGLLHACQLPVLTKLGGLMILHFFVFCLMIRHRRLMTRRGLITALLI